MTPTMISAAIIMVAVGIASIVWLHGYRVAASTRRMKGMMTRVGLDFGTATLDDPRTKAIMKETRRRCMKCPREDFCDRWLAGKVKGDNSFCRNAQTFRNLTGTNIRPG